MCKLRYFQKIIVIWLVATVGINIGACYPTNLPTTSIPTQDNRPANELVTDEILCPPDYKDINLITQIKGNLLFGKKTISPEKGYDTIYSLSLPSKEIKAIVGSDKNIIYQSLSVSQDGDMFSLIRLDDIEKSSTLEIYTSEGELINAILWNYENWWGEMGWDKNGIIALPISRMGEVDIIDPVSGYVQTIDIGFRESGYEILEISLQADQFMLGKRNPDDPNLYTSIIVWDAIRNIIIWQDDNRDQKTREVSWSNDGRRIVIISGRNNISILDRDGEVMHVLNIPSQLFVEGAQWALNGDEIYFWGKDLEQFELRHLGETFNDTGIFLYSYNLNTDKLERYCYSSLYSSGATRPHLIQVSSDSFIVENTTSYNWSLGEYNFELRLVDNSSGKSFLLGNDIEMLGWIPHNQ